MSGITVISLGPLAADRVAGGLGLGLLEPSDGWLVRLPEEFGAADRADHLLGGMGVAPPRIRQAAE
jgi:hypothetical protein